MLTSKMPLDVFVSVIDNYGDIGFVYECIHAFECIFPDQYRFCIWTDRVDMVSDFFSLQAQTPSDITIQDIGDFGTLPVAPIWWLCFHHEMPHLPGISPKLILRIDYLSLDGEWAHMHGGEHILSTASLPIIEIIPSPLPDGGGLIFPRGQVHTRQVLAHKYALDSQKRWVFFFAYEKTLEENISFADIPEDTLVLFFGNYLKEYVKNAIQIPFVDVATFHDFLRESDWAVVRGEVSFANALGLGKPLFWDMYKDRGGFPHAQSEDFLAAVGDTHYREIHERINGQKGEKVEFHLLDNWMMHQSTFPLKKYQNPRDLIQEMQKHIDRYKNSI